MTLKEKTVERLLQIMHTVLDYWKEKILSGDHVKASISDGNDKIGRTTNFSMAPVLSCGSCKACRLTCYAVKNCIRRGITVTSAWVKNYALAMFARDDLFNQLYTKCKNKRKHKFFRWHVSGDVLDADYFSRMVKLAFAFLDFRFWTYTEMQHIVNAYCDKYGRDAIPENFNIMFSDWSMFTGVAIQNPYKFKRFIVVPKNIKPEDRPRGFYCPGNCDFCKEHKCGCIYGKTDVYCNEH